MPTVFFNYKSAVHEYVPQGQAINIHFYLQVLSHICDGGHYKQMQMGIQQAANSQIQYTFPTQPS
jgi:hypothetical protein